VRATLESAEALIELTTGNGRIALGGSAGTITLTISATDTAALTAGRGVYDLELVSGSGIVTRLLQGVAPSPQRDEVRSWPLNWSSRQARPPSSWR
jgi:hypothetical protein